MYNMEDIFARLQNGDSAEKIAQEFADTLNAAVQKQTEEASKENDKIDYFGAIVQDLIEFIELYYPEVGKALGETVRALDTEDYKAMLKVLDVYMASFNGAGVELKIEVPKKAECACKKAADVKFDPDWIIRDFLKHIM